MQINKDTVIAADSGELHDIYIKLLQQCTKDRHAGSPWPRRSGYEIWNS